MAIVKKIRKRFAKKEAERKRVMKMEHPILFHIRRDVKQQSRFRVLAKRKLADDPKDYERVSDPEALTHMKIRMRKSKTSKDRKLKLHPKRGPKKADKE